LEGRQPPPLAEPRGCTRQRKCSSRTRGTSEVERRQRDHTLAQHLRHRQVGDRITAPGAGRRSPGAGSKRADRPERGRRPAARKGKGRRSLRRRGNAPRLTGAEHRQPRSRTGAAMDLDLACCQDGTKWRWGGETGEQQAGRRGDGRGESLI
jgi:hypothetical protein